jgi:hypothetical protein
VAPGWRVFVQQRIVVELVLEADGRYELAHAAMRIEAVVKAAIKDVPGVKVAETVTCRVSDR